MTDVVWKVYSKACKVANPIQDVSYKWEEEFGIVMHYQFEEAMMGGCIYISDETRELVDEYRKAQDECRYNDEAFDEAWKAVAKDLMDWFRENGCLRAGDWELAKLPEGEMPERPDIC